MTIDPVRTEYHSWLTSSPEIPRFDEDTPVIVRGSGARQTGVVVTDTPGDEFDVLIVLLSELVPVPRRVRRSRLRINLARPAGVAAALRLIYTHDAGAFEVRALGRITLDWQRGKPVIANRLVLLAEHLTKALELSRG